MNSTVRALRRLATDRPPPVPAGERCEMCAESIAEQHQHVVDVEARQLMCVCRGCYLLFIEPDAALRYRAVPQRYTAFPEFTLSQGEWDGLEFPVGLVFLFRSSTAGRTVAFYPGPAGATESELPLQNWQAILFFFFSYVLLESPANSAVAVRIRWLRPGPDSQRDGPPRGRTAQQEHQADREFEPSHSPWLSVNSRNAV